MTYFAAVLSRINDVWSGDELDLEVVEDLDGLVERLRDAADGGTALLFLEEDDEYVAIVRVDDDLDPRIFISDARAGATSALAAMVLEDTAVEAPEEDEDEEEGTRPIEEPAGDDYIVGDFGITAATLLSLCAEKGMLPADVITAICEKAGCIEALEDLRG